MITSKPTLLALGAVLSLSGLPAWAQYPPPAMVTDGMASRPSARPVAPTVTYGVANQPQAMAPAYAPAAPPAANAYYAPMGQGAYPAPVAGAAYAPDYGQGQPAGYTVYAPVAAPVTAPPPPPAYSVPPPAGAGYAYGYAPSMVTTATTVMQDPPALPTGPGPGYGYADPGMATMAPPSMANVNTAPVVYAPLPQYTPGARTQTPLPASYADMARQSVAEGDYARAQSGLEQAIKVNPFDPAALNNLAVAKAEQGQYNEAVELLERASRLAPGDAEIAANLQRMRGFLTSYAMTGTPDPAPRAPTTADSRLPPPPPPLWTRPGDAGMAVPVRVVTTTAPAVVMVPAAAPAPQPLIYTTATYTTAPQPVYAQPVYAQPSYGQQGGYYTSGVCENGVRRTAQGTVEACQTTR